MSSTTSARDAPIDCDAAVSGTGTLVVVGVGVVGCGATELQAAQAARNRDDRRLMRIQTHDLANGFAVSNYGLKCTFGGGAGGGTSGPAAPLSTPASTGS